MDMRTFSSLNNARCVAKHGFNHPIHDWSLSDWMTALTGEVGEAANIIKKLNRSRDGIIGNTEDDYTLREQLADELADTFIYLDLLSQRAGIDLADAVKRKFNATSKKIGYPDRI